MNKLVAYSGIMAVITAGSLLFGNYEGYVDGYRAGQASLIRSVPAPADPHAEFTFDNVLIRLNEARLANGLPQLMTDNYLSGYAQKDLEGNCPVTGHSAFRSEIQDFSSYRQVAESLDSGEADPKAAIAALLASPTHRDSLLSPLYVSVGIGTTGNCVSIIEGVK